MKTTVSERIQLIMKEFNLNKNSFSKVIGLTNNVTVGNIINEKREPGYQVLDKIIQTFDSINARWLITGFGEMYNNTPSVNPAMAVESAQPYGATPTATLEENAKKFGKLEKSVTPTSDKSVTLTVTPTRNFGLPAVVTIAEDERELIPVVGVKAAAGYLDKYQDSSFIETLPSIRVNGFRNATFRAFEVEGHSMQPTLYNRSVVIGEWVENVQDIRDNRIYIVHTTGGIVVKRCINRLLSEDKLIMRSDNPNKNEYPNIIVSMDDIKEVYYLRAALQFNFTEPSELYGKITDIDAEITILKHILKEKGVI